MTHSNKVRANQQNALRSTGPRTAAGKLRTRANGATFGLYAKLVVVEPAGETVAAWEQFRVAVVRDLAPAGPVETELAGRVAELMWRMRRPARYEAAVASASAANLPPHPDSVSGEGVDPLASQPADPPLHHQLAVLRALLAANRGALDVRRRGIELLGDMPGLPADEVIDWGAAEHLIRTAGDALGWPAYEHWDRWEAVLKPLGAGPQPEWTAGLLTRALAAAAKTGGMLLAELIRDVGIKLAADADNLAELIVTREAEERELVGRMLAERARAAAAALYSDERAAATVAKVERHLGRELERALGLLHGLQAARQARDVRVGDVLGDVLELGARREGVVALVEARGFGPLLPLAASRSEFVAGGDDPLLAGG